MNTRKSLLTIALIAAASAFPFAASAQVANPDNDSTMYFQYRAQMAGRNAAATLPSVGQVSVDGLRIYSGSDRGWIERQHAYVIQAGELVHAEDCLPYDLPQPVAGFAPPTRKGAFADHGA